MDTRNLLLKLQKKYQGGGYALISPRTGETIVFAENIENLYKTIVRKKIHDADFTLVYDDTSRNEQNVSCRK